MSEIWTEVRCPACVKLGWYASHLLLRMRGRIPFNDALLELKCTRCKSLIGWELGKPVLIILAQGVVNRKKQTTTFE